VLYDALYVWNQQQSLVVTDISKPFFSLFSSNIATGTYSSGTSTYKTLVSAIRAYADGFIAINAKYTPDDGSLSEQFDKATGVPTSAVHLTWSYASALTAFYARDSSLVPESWGAKGLKSPSVCLPGPQPPQSTVTFNVAATTVYGGTRPLILLCFIILNIT
jgi:glucoamylase